MYIYICININMCIYIYIFFKKTITITAISPKNRENPCDIFMTSSSDEDSFNFGPGAVHNCQSL